MMKRVALLSLLIFLFNISYLGAQDYETEGDKAVRDEGVRNVFEGVKSILDGIADGIEHIEEQQQEEREKRYNRVSKLHPPPRQEYYYIMKPDKMVSFVNKVKALKLDLTPIEAVKNLGYAPNKTTVKNNNLHQRYLLAQYESTSQNTVNDVYITLIYSEDYTLKYIRSNIRGVTRDKQYNDKKMMSEYGHPRWLLEDLIDKNYHTDKNNLRSL